MPKVNHVKSARKLYETKPVLNEDGSVKRTLVTKTITDYKTGEKTVVPKKDKRGNEVYHTVTVRDLDRPKPNLRCDFPNCDIDGGEILPGTSYKFIALRFGQRNRHDAHPNWQHWEYSSSVAASVARLQHDMYAEIDDFEFTAESDFDDLRDSLASQVQDFVDERQESVDNMPEQLQDGSQAQEYLDAAESWLSEVEGADAGSVSEEMWAECDRCEATGEVDNDDYDSEDSESDEPETVECPDCGGTGRLEDDTLNEDWVEEAKNVLRDAVDGAEF